MAALKILGAAAALLALLSPAPAQRSTTRVPPSMGASSIAATSSAAPLQVGGRLVEHRAAPRPIPYAEAQPLFDELRADLLPPDLRSRGAAARRAAWPAWVRRHDAAIRGRLVRGSEDSIVNLLFFGTRFTAQPRVRSADVESLDRHDEVIERRLDDLLHAVAAPGANGRLRFVRSVLEARAIDVTTAAGGAAARAYIDAIADRFIRDQRRYRRSFRAAKRIEDPSAQLFSQSTLYHDRGLSSDTSIFPNFALEQALVAIRDGRILGDRQVRRVGIVGPGLDFTDKEDGYDFYPQQTIQPFAIADSLVHLGLARRGDIDTTTFDVNPRVTGHLEAARLRARDGVPYVVELTRDADEHWTADLVRYWVRFGGTVGQPAVPVAPAENAGHVEVRAIRFAPAMVLRIEPRDLNIVLQRLDTPAGGGLDLIVATNVLVYYDVFEQGLALVNVARMLRPGGLFLTNTTVLPSPTMAVAGYTDTPYTDGGDGDRIWWYQRQ